MKKLEQWLEDLEKLDKKYNEAIVEIEKLKKTSNKGPEEAPTVPAPAKMISPKKKAALAKKLKTEFAASTDNDNEVPETKESQGDAAPKRPTGATVKDDANPSTRTRQIKP